MTLQRALWAAVLVMLLIGGCAFVVVRAQATGGRVYSVAEVQAGLWRDPKGWIGRTVRVRGLVVDLYCRSTSPCYGLVDRSRDQMSNGYMALELATGHPDPLLTLLRRIPLLGSALPGPQRLHRFSATYAVRLRPSVCNPILLSDAPSSGGDTCDEAVVLDGAPTVQ